MVFRRVDIAPAHLGLMYVDKKRQSDWIDQESVPNQEVASDASV